MTRCLPTLISQVTAKMFANFFQSIRVDHFNTCAVHRGCFRIDQRGLLIFLERAFTDLSDDSIDGAVLLVGKRRQLDADLTALGKCAVGKYHFSKGKRRQSAVLIGGCTTVYLHTHYICDSEK